ncbi:unnamed protein product [Lactuca saligna]|uniref:Uncharacterized protein n=1 Tax=Lactuca saligna TaxID=75948 RepID=A0AA35YDL1_LACSI|nr:unnamed protein product [Lactuca saligna]
MCILFPFPLAFLRILVLNSWCSSISVHHPARSRFSNQAKDNKYCSVTETESVIFLTPLWMRQKIVMILPFGRLVMRRKMNQKEKVGSLTFKVIDASSQRKSKEPSKQTAGVDVESSNNASQKPKSVGKKPVSRAKVPYQIGYSHMDWLKVTRTHPDLAGNSIV